MGIDFVTLIAQIINLLILIWLLKRFLYQPVLKVLTERQALIDEQINQAKKARKQAAAEEVAYRQKVAEFDAERNKMFEQAQEQATALHSKLSEEARAQVEISRKNWVKELEQEKQSTQTAIQNAIVKNFKLFASDALKDMAGVNLNDLVLAKFKEKVNDLPAAFRKKFARNVASVKKVIVTTEEKLDKEKKEGVQSFIISAFELTDIAVKFEFKTNADLICGIEIQVGEQLTSWNLQNYLQAFENNMDAAFNDLIHQGA